VNLVIPYVVEHASGRGLRPETRAFGERLGARFVEMTAPTSYWELVEELWMAEADSIVLEEDVLPPAGLVEDMWACTEPWCTGTFGRWRVGTPWGPKMLWSDASLGLVKYGAIRRLVPDAMEQAAKLFPARRWTELDQGVEVLGLRGHSAHLHLPHAVHLREGERYDDPWDRWEDWRAAILRRVGVIVTE
jgi:hypothetical protein